MTPLLVELRRLEKAPSLDELLGQHLIRHGMEDVELAKLQYMIRSGRIALLFDGFDELEMRVGYDNAADYLQVLLGSVADQAKVVLTSRTQHFLSDDQIRTALGNRVTGLDASRLIVLEDFAPNQILAFLANQYGGDQDRARRRFDLLDDIEDLLGLSANPRMLAWISQLDDDRLREIQEAHGRISAAELYRELIDHWLLGETRRHHHRAGLPTLESDERLAACTDLAIRLWSSTEPTIPLSGLNAVVGSTLTGLAHKGYDTDQAAHTVGSGSLLIRTEDGAFGFVHASVMEWLVADAAARQVTHGEPADVLALRSMSRLMVDFFIDLTGPDQAAAWANRVLQTDDATAAAKENAVAVRARRVPDQPERLAGVDLRGQDLNGRDLRGADLSGADLRDMVLREVQLNGADLRGARFDGARLTSGSLHE